MKYEGNECDLIPGKCHGAAELKRSELIEIMNGAHLNICHRLATLHLWERDYRVENNLHSQNDINDIEFIKPGKYGLGSIPPFLV